MEIVSFKQFLLNNYIELYICHTYAMNYTYAQICSIEILLILAALNGFHVVFVIQNLYFC